MAMTNNGSSDDSSDAERTVLCEKIIGDIQSVLVKDAALSSFEIIPVTLHRNKSPVIHVEHNLGLESWCAQHVYEYAHRKLIDWKCQKCQGTGGGGGGSNGVGGMYSITKYLDVALLINPDVQSFWHMRRSLFQKPCLSFVDDELRFTALVLSKKSKSSEAFAYRRWLYTNAGVAGTKSQEEEKEDINSNGQVSFEFDWQTEIELCQRCSEFSVSNYHAWSHRQWVVLNVGPGLERRNKLLSSEFKNIKHFMLKHITDYSCYHYRQWLISYAYRIHYFESDLLLSQETEESVCMQMLYDLQQLISYYLETDIRKPSDVLEVLVPGLSRFSKYEPAQLNSFLYCCNLAALDVQLCEEQKNVFGEHESFDMHRRASLKFIVDQCIRWLRTMRRGDHSLATSGDQDLQSGGAMVHEKGNGHQNGEILEMECTTSKFLAAVKKSEGLLGSRHRKWCSLFLGFNYSDELGRTMSKDCIKGLA